jgi:hypothetical protein
MVDPELRVLLVQDPRDFLHWCPRVGFVGMKTGRTEAFLKLRRPKKLARWRAGLFHAAMDRRGRRKSAWRWSPTAARYAPFPTISRMSMFWTGLGELDELRVVDRLEHQASP